MTRVNAHNEIIESEINKAKNKKTHEKKLA